MLVIVIVTELNMAPVVPVKANMLIVAPVLRTMLPMTNLKDSGTLVTEVFVSSVVVVAYGTRCCRLLSWLTMCALALRLTPLVMKNSGVPQSLRVSSSVLIVSVVFLLCRLISTISALSAVMADYVRTCPRLCLCSVSITF